MQQEDRSYLTALFDSAIRAADPKAALAAHLPAKPKGRVVVIGAGKASAQMAAALEELWEGPLEGVVVTRYGFGTECQSIRILEASHPVPDDAGMVASQAMFDAVRGLTSDDLVIALISGGGSALLTAPAEGLTLCDEIELNKSLLASGAPISVMNKIRKCVSRIKGGRLAAAAHPARVVSLIVSDVPGDDPADVASGPTVPVATNAETVSNAISNYKINLPASINPFLSTMADAAPSKEDPSFKNDEVIVIASAARSLEAAEKTSVEQGTPAVILSDSIEGEAREVAKMHAALAREVKLRNRPFGAPITLLSGGETTVTLVGSGKGGRNTEFLLSLALEIDGTEGIFAIAADTDGIDGSEDNAGAFVDGTSASRMRVAGIDPSAALVNNDAYTAFDAIGDIFAPGPTGTNVNDFRAILIR